MNLNALAMKGAEAVWNHAWLLAPRAVERRLEQLAVECPSWPRPNVFQISLGVVRMWGRVLFRSDTIGTCSEHPVRATWAARLLAARPVRFPFLLAARAVAPWDFSGLISGPDRIASHLVGAHHDGVQFFYDLQLCDAFPGLLDRVRQDARAIVLGSHPRAEALRDLCVFEGYHEALLEACEAYTADGFDVDEAVLRDPDLSLTGYLAWCATQPPTLAEWLSARRNTSPSSHPEGALS